MEDLTVICLTIKCDMKPYNIKTCVVLASLETKRLWPGVQKPAERSFIGRPVESKQLNKKGVHDLVVWISYTKVAEIF